MTTVNNTLNFAKDIISTSYVSTTSSLSSSITEKSMLSESSDYSFSSVTPEDEFSQELSASLHNLLNHGEQQENIGFMQYDSFTNFHENNMTIDDNEFSNQPHPPPLEFDVSPSDDQIISQEEFDAIFESFAAVADGSNDCKMIFRDNNIPMLDLLESEQLTQALESFSII